MAARHLHQGTHEPYLGTVATIRVIGSRRSAIAAERVTLAALEHWEAQFSLFRPDSELCRWRRGLVAASSPALTTLLGLGTYWQLRSGGILNPAVGVIAGRWNRAELEQQLPSDDELEDLAASVQAPRVVVEYDLVLPVGDCSQLTFHSFAKGLIVDWAASEGFAAAGVSSLLLNVGGDLVHRGDDSVVVGVEDPLRAYDNDPPICAVRLNNEAMATSGGARRGWLINGAWYSHVLDPRTARPVTNVASASVIAADAATADAIATVLSVLEPNEGLEFCDTENISALVIDAQGKHHANDGWSGRVVVEERR
jgi:FAD:protein FMN transferase